MRREKDVEQIVVAKLVRIEGHADRFGVAGVAGAHLPVGRVGDMPTGVAALNRLYPDDIKEHRFGAPEASARENCDLIGH